MIFRLIRAGALLFAAAAAFTSCASPVSTPAAAVPGQKARYVQPASVPNFVPMAMAPLWIDNVNWTDAQFAQELDGVKAMGVKRISVDVWWGKVATLNGGTWSFDFSYYTSLFKVIHDHGLAVVPILSFHSAGMGGSPGDYVQIPIPKGELEQYVNTKVPVIDPDSGQYVDHVIKSVDELEYVGETGKPFVGEPSLWADSIIAKDYEAFVEAFAKTFGGGGVTIPEVDVSLGPAGELRYPSYDGQEENPNNTLFPGYKTNGWPTRGTLQGYSTLAKIDYQWFLHMMYFGGKTISALDQAYGNLSFTAFSTVEPPHPWDTGKDAFDPATGPLVLRDLRWFHFMEWYHWKLRKHGESMLGQVAAWLSKTSESFAHVEIGYKIPGVHWTASPSSPERRAAEMTAGLINIDDIQQTEMGAFKQNVTLNLDSPHLYGDLVRIGAASNNTLYPFANPMVLYFTALEKPDSNQLPDFSFAKSIVKQVGSQAQQQGVTVRGENALADVSGDYVNDNSNASAASGWFQIDDAVRNLGYSGVNILRVGEVAVKYDSMGNPTGTIPNDLSVNAVGHAGTTAQRMYANIIQEFTPVNPATDLVIYTGESGWGALTNRQMWAHLYPAGSSVATADIPSAYVNLGGKDYHKYIFFDFNGILGGTYQYNIFQTNTGVPLEWDSQSNVHHSVASTANGKVYFQTKTEAVNDTPQVSP
jgi:hypothetical protein